MTRSTRKTLPARPDLDWLRNRARALLRDLRRTRADAKLSDAQLAVAREYGFASWRALKERVDALRAGPAEPPALPEEMVAKFLRAAGVGDRAAVESMLAAEPSLVHAVG